MADTQSVIWHTLTATPALFAATGGVLWGMFGGALPGISPSIALSLLLPLTYGMDPATAVILLASTYIGAEYGGSIPAILIRTPGTNAAVATVWDGYPMHRAGLGSEALGISLVSGVFGGLVGLIFLVIFSIPASHLALLFTPAAYFGLGVLALSAVVGLSGKSRLKGAIAVVIGLMIGTVGTDPLSGVPRFTLGQVELLGGIDYALIVIGLFAVSELMMLAANPAPVAPKTNVRFRPRHLRIPRGTRRAQIIGSGVGLFEGCMPGVGGSVAAVISYNLAKRWSKQAWRFGKGSPEGVAAPEAANNAVAYSTLVPTLTFGIPGSNSSAIILAGLLIHGIQPGPLLVEQNPELLLSLYTGLALATLVQIPLGLLVIGPCLWLIGRPKPYLLTGMLALILSGAFVVDNSITDAGIVLLFGLIGYVLRRTGFPLAPIIIALLLTHLLESSFRRALVLSDGSFAVFLSDPIAAGLLLAAIVLAFVSASGKRRPR